MSAGHRDPECRKGSPKLSRPIDFDRLLKLRLVVARVGEIDAARWWNTTSMLGPRGATVLERGLPATHYFAQARVVFVVAQARCDEVFSSPGGGITLWNLPAEVEDQFDEHWHTWLDGMNDWRPFFEMLANAEGIDLDGLLVQAELISPPQIDAAARLRRSADGRAVLVPNRPDLDGRPNHAPGRGLREGRARPTRGAVHDVGPVVTKARASVVSSFTIIKGSLIDETYAAFQHWDFSLPKTGNLERLKEINPIGARSANWLRDVAFVLSRRFDPERADRSLVELAQRGCSREIWKPLLLWHMTRNEFLVRDFLVSWLQPRFAEGVYRIRADDLLPYLAGLRAVEGIQIADRWTASTTSRVASGLLRIAQDFGMLSGGSVKEFRSYHLPDESFLYVLHAIAETEGNPRRMIDATDWRMYLMGADDVERELFRPHQFRRLRFEIAGSLVELQLPCGSAAEFARTMTCD